jgi:hypothetical protein
MKPIRKLMQSIFMLTIFLSINIAYAIPSGGVIPPEFTYKNGYWYDSWDYNRNYYAGEDGFLPNVAYESLGPDKELAYEIGEWFEVNYDNKVERAEAILNYVQTWTDYGYDEDNVFRREPSALTDEPQIEWAWNADEMAHMFDETTFSVAIGDCEDMAFLCATIYIGSKIEVALVEPPEHVALLIWLPEYDNANYYWDIPDDGREYGWIWVEATGETNPLGWTPPDYSNGDWNSFLLGFSKFIVEYSPKNPKAEDDVIIKATIESAISTINTVSLSYQIGANSQEIPMVKKGSYYEATIPKQPDGTKVTGTVYAVDSEDFFSEQKFEFVVGQELQFPPFLFEAGVIFLIIFILIILLARL